MNPPSDSLVKYDTPVLVTKNTDKKSSKARPLKVSPQQPAVSGPVPPPPKPQSPSGETQEILNVILPPREWTENNQRWVQQVSSAPCRGRDVVRLQEQLDLKLQQRQARETGLCPVRRELYSQCFDELIRQVTINCAERGLLLLRVRDESRMTEAAYQTLYKSGMAFALRKTLLAEQEKSDTDKRISDLENEKKDLVKQLNEIMAKREAAEKQADERRQADDKKRTQEIQFFKRMNQQLKDQLEEIISPKK
ncbi:axonemal dynein light intermediate polypeptide 1-like [Salminus brasiliensis]|uniref:axonemal dynein light intermediate polypeptide 1-like n=1 Tax=Salminus brasiliensis TaxID=930266 RepID=UPI003B8377B1